MLRRIIFVVGSLLLVLGLTLPVGAQGGNARIRVIHASPDAPAVDVFVDGKAVLSNVGFPAISSYLSVPAGTHSLAVAPAGKGEGAAVIKANPTLEAGKAYTVAAVGFVANIKAEIYADNLSAPAPGKAHVRVIHASPDAPAVAVKVKGGPTLIQSLAFPNASSYLPVAAGTYHLEVTPAGANTVVIDLPNTELKAGTIYDVVAVGKLSDIRVKVATFTPAMSGDMTSPLPATGAGDSQNIGLVILGLLLAFAGLGMRRRMA